MIILYLDKYIIILLYICFYVSKLEVDLGTIGTIRTMKTNTIYVNDIDLFPKKIEDGMEDGMERKFVFSPEINDIYIDKHLSTINLGSSIVNNIPLTYNYCGNLTYTSHLTIDGELIVTFYICSSKNENPPLKYETFQLQNASFKCPETLLAMFQSIRTNIISIIISYDKIHLTGFGLGANLAQLYALYISNKFDKKISLLTFSSLNLWDIDFITLLYNSQNIKHIYNIYHYNDINQNNHKMYTHLLNIRTIGTSGTSRILGSKKLIINDYVNCINNL